MKWWSQMKTTLSKSISQTNEKQLTWKAWAKNNEVRPTPWSSRPSRTGSSKNAIILSFKVKECKINQLHKGGCTPVPTVRWVTRRRVLHSHCSAWRSTAQLWSKEPWCAHQRCLLRGPIFPPVTPETSICYFLGWAERSSLAITSCHVNILSSMMVSCQEPWSQELTSTCLLDKNPGFITAEAGPFQRSKCALLAWSQAETLLLS